MLLDSQPSLSLDEEGFFLVDTSHATTHCTGCAGGRAALPYVLSRLFAPGCKCARIFPGYRDAGAGAGARVVRVGGHAQSLPGLRARVHTDPNTIGCHGYQSATRDAGA